VLFPGRLPKARKARRQDVIALRQPFQVAVFEAVPDAVQVQQVGALSAFQDLGGERTAVDADEARGQRRHQARAPAGWALPMGFIHHLSSHLSSNIGRSLGTTYSAVSLMFSMAS